MRMKPSEEQEVNVLWFSWLHLRFPSSSSIALAIEPREPSLSLLMHDFAQSRSARFVGAFIFHRSKEMLQASKSLEAYHASHRQGEATDHFLARYNIQPF